MDNSGLDLRSVLRAHDLEIVECGLGIVQLVLELHLALDQLPDLAVDLAQLLDHHLAQHLLTKLGDRHDRARTTRTLAGVRGGLVCTVVVALAHAIIIPSQATPSTTLAHKSKNISHFVVTHGVAGGYAPRGYCGYIVDN